MRETGHGHQDETILEAALALVVSFLAVCWVLVRHPYRTILTWRGELCLHCSKRRAAPGHPWCDPCRRV